MKTKIACIQCGDSRSLIGFKYIPNKYRCDKCNLEFHLNSADMNIQDITQKQQGSKMNEKKFTQEEIKRIAETTATPKEIAMMRAVLKIAKTKGFEFAQSVIDDEQQRLDFVIASALVPDLQLENIRDKVPQTSLSTELSLEHIDHRLKKVEQAHLNDQKISEIVSQKMKDLNETKKDKQPFQTETLKILQEEHQTSWQYHDGDSFVSLGQSHVLKDRL
ncbi:MULTISPECIES: hypothetical protein [Pasteurellaceae]|uniref:Transposase n=1 Tax=Pasteurella atlantica TaxID=2827233 RepID=A0AAW8CNV1_9PAST|nr:hypothetical protein [Pasteurella atlantica]MBR0573374.1 hypothetical protein [Pasteurella atlantica]MDP8039818.1 hypothetical protein [Pasteurella atlantica]MDP8041835.1 hypothetical protein [Pasteurella atlantica]MDP8043902.1 hypothetical protein [Pasteurella atlantica]MDP8046095.1 hypothetical protein [Pasteurella atlantica]